MQTDRATKRENRDGANYATKHAPETREPLPIRQSTAPGSNPPRRRKLLAYQSRVRRGDAMRKILVGFECAILQQLCRQRCRIRPARLLNASTSRKVIICSMSLEKNKSSVHPTTTRSFFGRRGSFIRYTVRHKQEVLLCH